MTQRAEQPAVSVIVPVYNAAKYLPAALDSIIAQTFQDFEIVAVNDGSTDDSGRILEEYASRDGRIRVEYQRNSGSGAARNKAILLARGNYVAMHDADDFSLPARLEKQAAFLDTHADVCAVYCRAVITDENLKGGQTILSQEDDATLRKVLPKGNVLQPDFMIRRDALAAVGGFREAFPCSPDYDITLRILEVGKIFCIPEPLYIYRTHGEQISSVKKSRQDEYGTLAKVFALERRITGRDSYDELASSRDLGHFVDGYWLRYKFNVFVAERKMRRLDIADARPYLVSALKQKSLPLKALALLAASYIPRGALQALRAFKNRFVDRLERTPWADDNQEKA